MAQGTCSIDGCGIFGLTRRSWCEKHYRRWLRTGDPLGHAPCPDLPGEAWLPVAGFADQYEVSDQGRVRNRIRGMVLSPGKGSNRHLHVTLCRPGTKPTTFEVHSLVLAAFVGPVPVGMEVLHGPGGPLDNRLVNLRYGTHAENMADKLRDGTATRGETHGPAKLTAAEVASIRESRRAGEPCAGLAERFGVSEGHISNLALRKSWKWLA